MKTQAQFGRYPAILLSLGLICALCPPRAAAEYPLQPASSIPASELGTKAGPQHHGEGLSVSPTSDGARLRCVFQKLEGQVTSEGLCLTSTAELQTSERFHMVAKSVGRAADYESGVALRFSPQSKTLPATGAVKVAENIVLFIRPGLIEEYSVSVDGVQQDFVFAKLPESLGDLYLLLDLIPVRRSRPLPHPRGQFVACRESPSSNL